MNELQEERRQHQQEERAEAIEQMAKAIFAEMGGDFEELQGTSSGAIQMKVRIGRTIQNEYVTRGVWEHSEWAGFPDSAGLHEVDAATFYEMLSDAEFQGEDPYGPDGTPRSIKQAYRRLAEHSARGGLPKRKRRMR